MKIKYLGALDKIALALIVLLPFFSISSEDKQSPDEYETTVQSEFADFNGEQVFLTGNVTVEHELGTIKAGQVLIMPPEKGSKNKLKALQFNDNIIVEFKEGGTLFCASALVDCATLCGTFFSNDIGKHVLYKEDYKGKNSEITPFAFRAKEMEVNLSQNTSKATGIKTSLNTIKAEAEVQVDFNNDFQITGDSALYQKIEASESPQNTKVSGLIKLNALKTGYCQVTNQIGDSIRASTIEIDTTKQELTFFWPQGILVSRGQKNQAIHFTANQLTWDHLSNHLTLQENVKIFQEELGNLETAEKVKIFFDSQEGKQALKAIETTGVTTLNYNEDSKGLSYTLTSHGSVKINYIKQEIRLFSPKDEEGKLIENSQIHFEDAKGEVFAEKALLSYATINGKFTPVKLTLTGNVKIFNCLSDSEKPEETALQYALADCVEYTPEMKEMVFKAKRGKRILFFDKANNLQVSAPALKIIREKGVDQEKIQGFGDVRFSFIEHEFEQLRKCFTLEKFGP